MAKQKTPVAKDDMRIGRRVSRNVAVLLQEIEKEPVPDRLLDLALQLQKELNDKLDEPGND